MNIIFSLLIFAVLFTVPLLTDVFAQTTYAVNIPTGAASPDAPYFWQSEKDGSTTGVVEILIGDSVVWKNGGTAFHDITSGSEAEGIDGIFDSGPFGHGKSFSYKFGEIGHYPYYCTLHPWMEGKIIVTSGYSIIPNVDKSISNGPDFFNIEYDFNRVLDIVTINEDRKSITFEIIGDAQSENHELELRLHSELIDGPFVIWVDGKNLTDFEHIEEGDLNVLFVPLNPDSKILTLVGTSIVPEFGPMVLVILGMSVVTMMILTQRFRPQITL